MERGKKLSRNYFRNSDVVHLAKDLLGKWLFTNFDGIVTGGIITETEAYAGVTDKASHAFGGKRSTRTEIMYADGGTSYVYLCYGIHSLFNIVTNLKDTPHAVLIRAIYPTHGMTQIVERRALKNSSPAKLMTGPGSVSKGLGIHFSHTGMSLMDDKIWVEDRKLKFPERIIRIGPRIGIDYAGKDALLPFRFYVQHQDIPAEVIGL